MRDKLKDVPWLQEKLIPRRGVGCRRLTPGIGYLEALSKPNVKVICGGIEAITENGCKCDGIGYPVDVLICATGFVSSTAMGVQLTKTLTSPRTPLLSLDFPSTV